MFNELISSYTLFSPKLIKLKLNFLKNIKFYTYFCVYLMTKLNILNNFFWKISNFSDLYWFFYNLKDVKTLNYLSK